MNFSDFVNEGVTKLDKEINLVAKKIEGLLKKYNYPKQWNTLKYDKYGFEIWIKDTMAYSKYDDLCEKIIDILKVFDLKLQSLVGEKAGEFRGSMFHKGAGYDRLISYKIYGNADKINESRGYKFSGNYGDTPEEIKDTLEACEVSLRVNNEVIKNLKNIMKIFKKLPEEFRVAPGYQTYCVGYTEEALKCAEEYRDAWQNGKREMENELK